MGFKSQGPADQKASIYREGITLCPVSFDQLKILSGSARFKTIIFIDDKFIEKETVFKLLKISFFSYSLIIIQSNKKE
jgi:hypothetical protein